CSPPRRRPAATAPARRPPHYRARHAHTRMAQSPRSSPATAGLTASTTATSLLLLPTCQKTRTPSRAPCRGVKHTAPGGGADKKRARVVGDVFLDRAIGWVYGIRSCIRQPGLRRGGRAPTPATRRRGNPCTGAIAAALPAPSAVPTGGVVERGRRWCGGPARRE